MKFGGDFIGREYHITVMYPSNHHPQPKSSKKPKRVRIAFTTDQINYMEMQFKKYPYIGSGERKEIATALNLPERAIKIWFQNRRMKGKRESTTKEEEDENEKDITKSLDFTNGQLCNVSASSSSSSLANEQLPSLPLLFDSSQGNYNKNIGTNNFACTRQMVQCVETKEYATKIAAPVIQNVMTTSKFIHSPSVFAKTSHSAQDFKTSADFSFDLFKKYKSETFTKPLSVEVNSIKKDVEDIMKIEESRCVRCTEQMTPEDLSPRRKMNVPAMGPQATVSGNASSNPGFVSLVPTVTPFYTQPYIPSSGIIWKPLSVLPVATSSSTTVSAPCSPMLNMSPVQDKTSCNCDCNGRHHLPQVPYNFAQQSPSPQYIITALPYQNPNKKL